MKILMIPSGYYPECCGGVEVMTQILAEGLTAQGHEVTVLCCSDRNQRQRINNVRIIRMRPYQIYSHKNVLTNRINRMLQMYNPFHITRFYRLIRELAPDVIHLHMARTLSMSILTAARLSRIPTISTLHEYFSLWNFDPFHRMEDVVCTKPPFYVEWIRNIHRLETKHVQYVTSPMPETFQIYLKERYYSQARYIHITNALKPFPPEKTEYYRRIRQSRKPKKFLMIGRLMPFKGIENTLEIFSDRSVTEQFELHIAGDGPMRTQIEKICQKHDNIYYHGFVIDDAKEKLFANCDMLIFLTSELETYGLVVAEAFQRCMPAIVSDVQAMRNIVSDKNGIIIQKLDRDSFLSSMRTISQGDNYVNMVDALSNMEWEKQYKRMLSRYQSVYLSAIQNNNQGENHVDRRV